eukprot:Pgem_evm1s5447
MSKKLQSSIIILITACIVCPTQAHYYNLWWNFFADHHRKKGNGGSKPDNRLQQIIENCVIEQRQTLPVQMPPLDRQAYEEQFYEDCREACTLNGCTEIVNPLDEIIMECIDDKMATVTITDINRDYHYNRFRGECEQDCTINGCVERPVLIPTLVETEVIVIGPNPPIGGGNGGGVGGGNGNGNGGGNGVVIPTFTEEVVINTDIIDPPAPTVLPNPDDGIYDKPFDPLGRR